MKRIEKDLAAVETVSGKSIEEVLLELATLHTVRSLFDTMELALDGFLKWVMRKFRFERLFGDHFCAFLNVLVFEKVAEFELDFLVFDLHKI